MCECRFYFRNVDETGYYIILNIDKKAHTREYKIECNKRGEKRKWRYTDHDSAHRNTDTHREKMCEKKRECDTSFMWARVYTRTRWCPKNSNNNDRMKRMHYVQSRGAERSRAEQSKQQSKVKQSEKIMLVLSQFVCKYIHENTLKQARARTEKWRRENHAHTKWHGNGGDDSETYMLLLWALLLHCHKTRPSVREIFLYIAITDPYHRCRMVCVGATPNVAILDEHISSEHRQILLLLLLLLTTNHHQQQRQPRP